MEIGPDGAIRGEVRAAGHLRLAHGLYRAETPHLDAWSNFLRDLSALRMILPPGAVFTHVTGARLLGWDLPALPEQVPYFAAVRGAQRPRRPGVICSRLTKDSESITVHGLAVEEPAEILLRAARDLGDLDLAIMLESAFRLEHVDDRAIERVLEHRRPGTARLRRVWQGRNPRAESPGETLLYQFHTAMDVAVEPQYEVFDDDGNFVCRADLRVVGTTSLHEYDGAVHRTKAGQRRDLRRERDLTRTPYVRRGFTLDDLLNHPAVVMHELDRILDRPHRAARLHAWRGLVSDSLYSASGRARVMNRWRRSTTPVGWLRASS